MADQKDYYETLGVSRDADDDTIRKAFRKLSKKYHPDLNHAPGAEQKFKDINEAYQVLSDPQKRAAYDQYGSADGPQGFGGAGAGHARAPQRVPQRPDRPDPVCLLLHGAAGA